MRPALALILLATLTAAAQPRLERRFFSVLHADPAAILPWLRADVSALAVDHLHGGLTATGTEAQLQQFSERLSAIDRAQHGQYLVAMITLARASDELKAIPQETDDPFGRWCEK
ncbi:MAG: hypothetical protein ACYCW6_12230 [Candidatus Xenobia bacterium]